MTARFQTGTVEPDSAPLPAEAAVDGLRITAAGVTFAYRRGADPVLDSLDLEVVPGTVTVLTGASGAGKSTLLYVLALLLPPTAGTLLWKGRPVGPLPDGERARLRAARSGFVFQDAILDPSRTVLDNVCESALIAGIPTRTARARARVLLERFGVGHRAGHRPGEISGGQAQRVALCRALVTDPGVVFGDEPTGNLDDASAQVVWDALRAHAARGATVILATHDQTLARAADRHVVVG